MGDPNFWLRFALPLFVMAGAGLVGAVHALTRPSSAWEAIGQSKALWVVLNLLFTFLAAILYFLFVAPKLSRARKGAVPRGTASPDGA